MLADAWVLKEPRAALVRERFEVGEPAADEAIVEVIACGLCHTDLGFFDGSVAPRAPLPLVLGHEIVGRVVEAGSGFSSLVGQRVLVPAVLPCGGCAFCEAGRGNACPKQKMPGNDIHGGFATHVRVPAAPLVSLADAPPSFAFDALSVVADAVSTAYRAVERSGLGEGDVAFVIGAGGVGGYTAQIAAALGARVIACDVDAERMKPLPVERPVAVAGRDPKELKKELHAIARDWRVPSLRWRIFECSGTAPGQALAYSLLAQAATLALVGYTREPSSLRLSNLMAFDATAFGSWGCPPEAYPEVLALIYAGKVAIEPFIERAPMSRLDHWLAELGAHRLSRRLVLDPNN